MTLIQVREWLYISLPRCCGLTIDEIWSPPIRDKLVDLVAWGWLNSLEPQAKISLESCSNEHVPTEIRVKPRSPQAEEACTRLCSCWMRCYPCALANVFPQPRSWFKAGSHENSWFAGPFALGSSFLHEESLLCCCIIPYSFCFLMGISSVFLCIFRWDLCFVLVILIFYTMWYGKMLNMFNVQRAAVNNWHVVVHQVTAESA